MKTTFDFILPITHEVSFRNFTHVGDLRIKGEAILKTKFEHPDIEIKHIYFQDQEITKLMNFFFEEWSLDGFEKHIKDASYAHIDFTPETNQELIND
jgi:hypothetical protein